MIFCEECFCDTEIKNIIREIGRKGECSVCHEKNVFVYDTEVDDGLEESFDKLISIYTPATLLPYSFPKEETKLLKSALNQSWNIFNRCTEAQIYKIIKGICAERYGVNPELFDMPVGLKELYDKDYLKEYSLFGEHTWEDFASHLKFKNRFHTHYINLDLLKVFFSYITKHYEAGKKFYRCRISSRDSFSIKNMGAPPEGKSGNGRVNAFGIQCLYLGDSKDTVTHEVRAGLYDYVTIGTFILKEDIDVIDLKRIHEISPFIPEVDCKVLAVNMQYLKTLNSQMEEPQGNSDSDLNYIPMQYIADFIKSISKDDKSQYAGVEYKSVMYKGGVNIAIFNPNLFNCVGTEIYQINKLDYGYAGE